MVDIVLVYRQSGSTEYLLGVFHEINGKSPNQLDDLEFFYENYQEIYQEVLDLAWRQLDEEIARINQELAILNDKLEHMESFRSWSIDTRLEELRYQATASRYIARKIGLRARAFILAAFRNLYINRPLRSINAEIRRKESYKNGLIAMELQRIEDHYQKLMDTYNFIHANRSLIEDAKREEKIVQALSILGNDYHVINNVGLGYSRKLLLQTVRKALIPCRITHVVIGPSGLFIIKMMLSDDMKTEESQKCLRQAVYINRKVKQFLQMHDLSEYEVKVRTVIVTFDGNYSGTHIGESLDLVSADRLGMYIKKRKYRLTNDTIDELVGLFSR